ncbi:MAG TPA: glycosyltransferase family 39 protein, partial [Vicinamibacterales bacterium]|nr:glycosyltransferase family 39 protein [Vicinamibacterales bacterium]
LYSAGMRWGRWVAFTAAALLAVWPNHVRESHFALTDVPLTFLTTSTFLLSLRAYESGRLSWWLGAGAAAGLASASKYSGAYAVMLPVIAAAVFHAPAGDRLVRMAAAVTAAGLAFLIAAPYTVLDLPRFLNAFAALSEYYRPRPFGQGAIIYLLHIRAAIGLGGLFAIAVGLVWGTLRAVRGNELRRWALVVLFPLAYFYAVATKHLIFARYLLPAVPLLCLIMAIGLVDATRWVWQLNRPMRTRAAVLAVGLALVLFPIVRAGITWPLQYGHTTTQDIAYARIRESIPYGSGVAVERSVLRLPDSLYRKTDVPQFTVSTPEQHIARGSTFLVASSDAFGPVLDRPSERAAEYAAYRRLFDDPGHCLPAIEPTPAITGPRIIICRLDSPIQ